MIPLAHEIIANKKRDHDGSPHTRAALDAVIGMQRALSAEVRDIRDEEVEYPSENSILVGDKLYVRVSYLTDRLGLNLSEGE